MLKELEQVGKLLESGQNGACLAYIETLEKAHPDCACLASAKLSVYRAENRWQEALPIAERFHAKEPDNPTAAAEYALVLVVTGNPILAVSTLVDAFERAEADTVHSTLLHAALQVGVYLLLGRLVVPAIAIGNVLKEVPAIAESANMLLYRATSEANIPLLLRDWAFDFDCPDDFPGKAAFEEIAVLVRLMRWKQALAQLETLTQYADSWSGIVRNIAALHFWLLDNEKGCEALKTYSSLPNTALEDAVDAEVTRFLFVPDPLGDHTESLAIEYIITDTEKALEKLLSDPLMHSTNFPVQSMSPPPRGSFVAMDRPLPEPGTPLTHENVPMQLAVIILFGKETDRDARILVHALLVNEQEMVEAKLRTALGDLVQIPGNIIRRDVVSQTKMMIQSRYFFPPEKYTDYGVEMVRKLFDDYNTTFFPEKWSALPMGLLDGNTPSEAAKEPKYTVSLLAAVQMVEQWQGISISSVIPDLRSRLGLPAQDTIAVVEPAGEDAISVLDAYPVWRWHRFDVAKLSTEVLAGGLQIVMGMKEDRASAKFAQELLARPMDSMEFPVRIMAFEALITTAQTDGDIEEALLWVERAKNESAAQNVPDAAWCLHEATLRLSQGNNEAFQHVIQYLMENYRNDADVMGALQELFVRMGVLNPDGTPSAAFVQSQAAAAHEPTSHQGLWTPGGSESSGAAATSKLWVPD